MREPDWVYRQRRQRAAAVVTILIGAIVTIGWVGSTVGGGFDPEMPVDLEDETPRVAIDRPDTDQVLAREKEQIEAAKERKRDRRARRAERAADRRSDKQAGRRSSPGSDDAPQPASAPAGGAPAAEPSAPSPSPAPEPAPAPAPEPDPPATPSNGGVSPVPSSGGVDPRFY